VSRRATWAAAIAIVLAVLVIPLALVLAEGPPAPMSPPRTYPQGTP
jgi:hypothetical protein